MRFAHIKRQGWLFPSPSSPSLGMVQAWCEPPWVAWVRAATRDCGTTRCQGFWSLTLAAAHNSLLQKRKINCYPVAPLLILVFVTAAEHAPHAIPKPSHAAEPQQDSQRRGSANFLKKGSFFDSNSITYVGKVGGEEGRGSPRQKSVPVTSPREHGIPATLKTYEKFLR